RWEERWAVVGGEPGVVAAVDGGLKDGAGCRQGGGLEPPEATVVGVVGPRLVHFVFFQEEAASVAARRVGEDVTDLARGSGPALRVLVQRDRRVDVVGDSPVER